MFPVSAPAGSTDLARVAPENTTLYIGWSGRDQVIEAAEGAAAGKTLADPQVQRILGTIAKAIDRALPTRAVPPNTLPVYEAAQRVLSILYRHPTALMVLNMEMDPNTGPVVSSSTSGLEAFRLALAGGMVGLGDLPGGTFGCAANGVSADGSTVVRVGNSTLGQEAFRWTAAGHIVGLGDLPGGGFFSEALDV